MAIETGKAVSSGGDCLLQPCGICGRGGDAKIEMRNLGCGTSLKLHGAASLSSNTQEELNIKTLMIG